MLGVTAWFYLSDRPGKAGWLSEVERSWLSGKIAEEHDRRETTHTLHLKQVLVSPKSLATHLVVHHDRRGYCRADQLLAHTYQGPISKAGNRRHRLAVGDTQRWRDYRPGAGGEPFRSNRRTTLACRCTSTCSQHGLGTLYVDRFALDQSARVTLAQTGMISVMGPFWSMPTAFLSGRAAAGGIALINAFGNLGGFFAPGIIGELQSASGDYTGGMLVMSGTFVVTAILAISVKK